MRSSFLMIICVAGALSFAGSSVAWAQNTNADWNGTRQFRSANDRAMDLTRADMQKKAAGGYYQSWSQNVTVNNMVTTFIGAYNQTTIGDGVSGVSVSTAATNNGCGDASISVGTGSAPGTPRSCGN